MRTLLLALSLFCAPFLAAQTPAPADTPASSPSGISRENTDNPLVRIETSLGDIVLELFPREAPETVANFIGLAQGTKPFTDPLSGEQVTRPFYDGLVFHRVVDDFMIQGGSPSGEGSGGPGYTFANEINARSLGLDKMQVIQEDGTTHPTLGIRSQAHFQQQVLEPLYASMDIESQEELEQRLGEVDQRLRGMTVKESLENLGYGYSERYLSRAPTRGVIAMANSGPDSNGSQFFINLIDTPWLTGRHTVFGKVRAGMEVADAIGQVPVDASDRPLEPVQILSVRRIE